MSRDPEVRVLYTLYIKDTPVAICALVKDAFDKDERGTICDAFVEVWMACDRDCQELANRDLVARTSTPREAKIWDIAVADCDEPTPYLIFDDAVERIGAMQ
jgi:hypothetical protein